MKSRKRNAVIGMIIITALLSQETMAGFKPSDLGKKISEAAGNVADAAGQAGEAITDAAGQAGNVISDAAGKAGGVISNVTKDTGRALAGAGKQVGEIAAGFGSKAGEVVSGWAAAAGKTTDKIKKDLAGAGVTIMITAEQFGNATAEQASALTEKAGKTADDAIHAVSGAADYVIDQSGHVVDLAAAGAGYVTSAAGDALKILKEKGDLLMKIAEDAVADIDLSEPESWDKAKVAVDDAIEKAYDEGLLDSEVISDDTIHIVTSIVFATMMYGYQYSNNQITLGEYVGNMSEVLIREGLPSGVGFMISLLPIGGPHTELLAKEATMYLISVAYGDKSGDEIEAEEELMMEELMDEESITEDITEAATEGILE